MNDNIIKYCKKLRLANVASEAAKIQASTHEHFLEELLFREVENRKISSQRAAIKKAGFDIIKTFEGYSTDHIIFPNTISYDEIRNGSFIEKKENLICYGAEGRGKTHLLIAAGIKACELGYRVKHTNVASLVNELVEAQETGQIRKFMKQFEKIDLLLLDEWGYVPVDSQGAKLLFQVVASCYERKSIILTTNLEFGRWNGIFMDDKLTAALIDRLIHHSHLLIFDDVKESYRLTHSLMNKRN